MTSYKEAGVDVEAKENVIEDIKESVAQTFTEDVLSSATTFKFGGTISLKALKNYDDPVLVLSTDGVGTKMIIAEKMKKFDTVGVDILNHSINDVLTSGAKAMFFLDYVASARLDVKVVKEIVEGIARDCKKQGIILAGGETAEMPGVYHDGKYELSGTVGGIVERENIIDGSKIKKGDVLIGLGSSGLHTNGYSLARKILFEDNNYSCDDEIPEVGKLGDALLATHKEYASSVLPLIDKKVINGIIHITGGGFPGNIPRIMPKGLGANVTFGSWEVLPVFKLIQKLGNVTDEEMLRTFNMGIGMILVVDKEKKDEVISMLKSEKVYEIGEIVAKEGSMRVVEVVEKEETARDKSVKEALDDLGINADVRVSDVYYIDGLGSDELEETAKAVFSDSLTQNYEISSSRKEGQWIIEVRYKDNVSDPAEDSIIRAIKDFGKDAGAVRTAKRYYISNVNKEEVGIICKKSIGK